MLIRSHKPITAQNTGTITKHARRVNILSAIAGYALKSALINGMYL